MTAMRYLEERTGLSLGRLCCPSRAGAGAAILLTGLFIQISNLV